MPQVLPDFCPQALANLGWGLAAAGAFPPALVPAWRAAAGAAAPRFGPRELSQLHQVELALRLGQAGAELAGGEPGGAAGKASPALRQQQQQQAQSTPPQPTQQVQPPPPLQLQQPQQPSR